MNASRLTVRELQIPDIDFIIHYWLNAEPEFLTGMGVDLSKIPGEEEWRKMLTEQTQLSYEEKKSYCIIWLEDGNPVGHSNINKIIFGKEAFMHLHLWNNTTRKKGCGTAFVKLTLPFFFKNYHLEKLYCEPYALNPAPNKTMAKLGFRFVREYTTIPGWLNFEQPVKLWELTIENYLLLMNT
jgi:RimJ/RimL family protein N-acetyltransferase